MNFQELLKKYDWDNVWNTIRKEHPREFRNLKGYRHVYRTLLQLTPGPSTGTLQIKNHAVPGEPVHPDVFMLIPNQVSGKLEDYSLAGASWEELISLELAANIDKTVPALTAISYALFELTFYGFTEQSRTKTFNKICSGFNRRSAKHKKGRKFSIFKSRLPF